MTDYYDDAISLSITDNSRIAPGAVIGAFVSSAAITINGSFSLLLGGDAFSLSAPAIQSSSAPQITVAPTGGMFSDGTVVNLTGGTVTNHGGIATNATAASGTAAIIISQAGSITNDGTITGDVGLNTNNNSQSIASTHTSVVNYGEIIGRVNSNHSTADVTNDGTIAGLAYGVAQSFGGTLTLVNNGIITGATGVKSDFSVTTQILVDNHGVITGSTFGIQGANGDDTITNSGLIVGTVFLNGGTDVYDGSLGHIRGAIDMGAGNDTATGGDGAETISGGDGNDILNGGGGNDTLNGGNDNDILDGGAGVDHLSGNAGDDTFYVDNARDLVFESTGQGNDTVFASVNYVLQAGQEVEHLKADPVIGTEPINLTGNELANELTGNDGANKLDGKGGGDTMIGLGGDDTYIVHAGNDVVIEAAGGGNDTVYTSVDYTLAAGQEIENLRASGTGPLHLTGNEIANTLIGNAGANTLDGGIGADVMKGGGGDDIYIVDNAGDQVVESYGQGNDTVMASVTYTITSNAVENLTLTGHDAIDGTGNNVANQLVGNDNNNTLSGKGGNDTLTGGGGADTFVFNTALNAATNVDTITDFSHGDGDKIALDDAYFKGITASGGALNAADFTTATPTTKDQHIIYDAASGTLSYDHDGSGTAYAAVVFAHVTPNTALDHTDFVVI